ncbi:unnamed protein product [Tetraodon nigroviridis]|uniref:(spotted green pufferfish) hypothetical protein n=1 Tax=Tetraodon nigroviridis TaxID=99883 RepID=Q4SLT2_TETNG|nr:unnamed protein product [Tetraodon nigroviridis]
MDDLTEALSASFAVSKEHNSTAAPHPRLAQYKCKYSALEQSERRRHFLELQKRSQSVLQLFFSAPHWRPIFQDANCFMQTLCRLHHPGLHLQ